MRTAVSIIRRLFLGAVVACLLAVGGTLWLARSDWGRQWTMRQVAAALGPSVRVADAHLAPWPPPLAVALDGVEVLDASGTPVVRARHVVARVRLRGLIGHPPLIAHVLVDGIEVELSRTEDGFHLGVGGRAGARLVPPPALDADCPRVDLHDGRVMLRETRDGVAHLLQVDDITAAVTPLRPGARLTVHGRSAQLGALRADATFDRLADLQSAPLRGEMEARGADAARVAEWLPVAGAALAMTGRGRLAVSVHGRTTALTAQVALDLHEGEVAWRDRIRAAAPIAVNLQGGWGTHGLTSATGQVDVAHVQVAGLEATAVRGALSADAAGVTVRDAEFAALGGHWRQAGTVRLAEAVTLDGGLDADAVDGAAAAAALHQLLGDRVAPLQLTGPVALHVTASGTVGAPLTGQVAVTLPDGTAGWGTTIATGPLSVRGDASLDGSALTVRNAHVQAARLSDRDLAATAVDVQGAFDGTAVQIAALSAQAFDGTVQLSGTVPLQGAPTLSLSAAGINAAHLARAALTGRPDDTGTAGDVDITATLQGGAGRIALRLASPTLTFGPLLIAQPASATGTLSWSGTGVRISNGGAQLAQVRFAGNQVGNVRAAFASAGPGQLRVAPLTARAFGGDWRVTATLARDEIDSTGRVTNVDLDALLATLGGSPRSERATASVDATVRRGRDGVIGADVAIQLLRGRFLLDDLAVTGPGRGTAQLRIDGTRWTVTNGVASAAAASYAMLNGTHPSARLDFGPDRIHLVELGFTTAGAPWQCSGTIDLDAPSIDGSVAFARADPDAVLALMGWKAPGLDPDGFDLSLSARAPLTAAWRQGLQGSGTMALRGGYLTSTGLLRAVVAAIVPTRSLRDGGPPNRLTSLTQSFTLGDGRVRTQNLTVDSDDYDLTAAGSFGYDASLDLTGRITLTPNGIKKIFALSAVPIPGSNLWSLPPIPARIDGTLEKPAIHPEGAALAGSTARWFADALIGAPRTIGETVVQPLDWMFRGVRDLVVPRTPAPAP